MTNTDDIRTLIDSMSVEEMKERLAAYMTADNRLAKRPVRVEVRESKCYSRKGRYEVVLILANGSERVVNFKDRYSRLVYIYTLLHPKGYQRYTLTANNYNGLCQLFSKIYFTSADALRKSIGKDFAHFFCQAVAQSRKAVRASSSGWEDFVIAPAKPLNGKTVIPSAQKSGCVSIASSLLTTPITDNHLTKKA